MLAKPDIAQNRALPQPGDWYTTNNLPFRFTIFQTEQLSHWWDIAQKNIQQLQTQQQGLSSNTPYDAAEAQALDAEIAAQYKVCDALNALGANPSPIVRQQHAAAIRYETAPSYAQVPLHEIKFDQFAQYVQKKDLPDIKNMATAQPVPSSIQKQDWKVSKFAHPTQYVTLATLWNQAQEKLAGVAPGSAESKKYEKMLNVINEIAQINGGDKRQAKVGEILSMLGANRTAGAMGVDQLSFAKLERFIQLSEPTKQANLSTSQAVARDTAIQHLGQSVSKCQDERLYHQMMQDLKMFQNNPALPLPKNYDALEKRAMEALAPVIAQELKGAFAGVRPFQHQHHQQPEVPVVMGGLVRSL